MYLKPLPNYSNIFRAVYDGSLSTYMESIFDPEPENPCTIYIELAYSTTVERVTFYLWRNDSWCMDYPNDCRSSWNLLNDIDVKIGGMPTHNF